MSLFLWFIIIIGILFLDITLEINGLKNDIKRLNKRVTELDISTIKIIDIVKKDTKAKKKTGRVKKSNDKTFKVGILLFILLAGIFMTFFKETKTFSWFLIPFSVSALLGVLK